MTSRLLLLPLCCAWLLSACGAPGPARPATATIPEFPVSPSLAEGLTAFELPTDWPAAVATSASASTAPVVPPGLVGLATGRFAGYEALLIRTPRASAAVALHGGHLLSWVPAGADEVLWLSPDAKAPPDAIRGGVPVIWPYFGRQGQSASLPSHGFVRTLRWELVEARLEDDGALRLVMAPPPLSGPGLQLRMELRIGDVLEQSLVTRNTGAAPVTFTQALHTYYRVSDVAGVRVEGLDGIGYLDKNEGYAAYLQRGDWRLDEPRDPGRSDRIYNDAPGRYVLDDPGARRRIELEVEGSRSLVLWNPGEATAARMDDVGEHWRGFLCLEAANAGAEYVELAPGASHRLTQRVRVVPAHGAAMRR